MDGEFSIVGIKDVDKITINPATEEKQDAIIVASGGATAVGDVIVTLITPGTAVQFPDIACRRAFTQADDENTGKIRVGGSNTNFVGKLGVYFARTQGDWQNVSNLNLLYMDGAIAQDKVNIHYEV